MVPMLDIAVVLSLAANGKITASAAARQAVWVELVAKPIPKGGVRPEWTPLSPRALERRAHRRTEPGLVDARDLRIAADRLAAVLATGASYRAESRWLNAISVEASDAERRAIARLPFVKAVRPIRPSHPVRPVEPPVAADGGIAGDYGFMQAQLAQIAVPSMHLRGFHGEGMVIGILDTGFHRGHEAFHSAEHPLDVLAEWDFINHDGNTGIEPGDPDGQHWHGTWILGTLAAYRPGTAVGSAYAARFVLAKTEVVPTETPVEEDYYVAGLEFIEASGADVATSSLGYIDWYTPEMLDGATAVTTVAVNVATANGLVCVTAAGNGGHDADPATHSIIAPADAFSVITCGAADASGGTAWFTSDGPTADGRLKPEVLADGVGVASVHSTDQTGYQAVSGTSLSTPLVAGAVSLILQARPDLGVATLRDAIFATASDTVASGGPDSLFIRGHGVISAIAAARRGRAAEDLDLDGSVRSSDLAILLGDWGPCTSPDPATGTCRSDLDGNGEVDSTDLARLLGAWSG